MDNNFKNIPKDERPREKALKYGVNSLSDNELLEILIRCGTKHKDVRQLSYLILNKYHNFNNLIHCNFNELKEIDGINDTKAIEILAIAEMAKRAQKTKINKVKKINDPEDVFNYFSALLDEEKQEVFMVIFLNIKSHIIKYEKLFVGGINFSIIDVNLIFKLAINYGASKIICLHNHPSGDPTPSNQDILITKKISNIGEILNVKLLDHIIIGKQNYISLKKESYI